MTFKKHPTELQPKQWRSGIYKITKYPATGYFAYFKPDGWKNWGNSVQMDPSGHSTQFRTLQDAKDACEKHSARYPEKPNQLDRLPAYGG